MYTKEEVKEFLCWSTSKEASKIFSGQHNITIIQELEYWNKNIHIEKENTKKISKNILMIIQRQWTIVKDLLQINGEFKMDSKIYNEAMKFEDELYNIK